MELLRPVTRFTGVHGTMHRDPEWARSEAPLRKLFNENNLVPLYPDDPFCWSGDVNGWQFWRRFTGRYSGGDREDWEAGGSALRWYLAGAKVEDRGCIAHSHGLWPVIEAAAHGLKIPWLISVGSPIREDMEDRIKLARPNIGAWLHIYDPHFDWWGMWGSFGDGKFNWNRAQRYAGEAHDYRDSVLYSRFWPRAGGNDPITGVGHSGILVDPQHFHYWTDRNWWAFMLRDVVSAA